MSIRSTLVKVYEKPKEYLADVCFCFPTIQLWAHRAIILTRAPKDFVKSFIPEVLKDSSLPLKLDISHLFQQETFDSILRFWYTDSFTSDASYRYSAKNRSGLAQLKKDIYDMLMNSTAADVTIGIISSDDNKVNATSFKAHKFILAAQSPYFYSLFCTQFQEACSSDIQLTDDLFSPVILHILLQFFYTNQIILPDTPGDALEKKKHQLSVLQKVFCAADYLGHSETLCNTLLVEMQKVCHEFKCHCPDCAVLLPSMLAWTERQAEVKLRETLVSLYCNPVHSIPTFWSQRSFSVLIASLNFRPVDREPLMNEIERRMFANVNKHNAVQVLQSLYLCLSHIRSTDPAPTWSKPALNLLEPLLDYTVRMVSQHFDYYCVEYPILPSCVDGTGFSPDFLDFLLRQVLKRIQEVYADAIYQGIARDLARRHEAVKNVAVGEALERAKDRCALYIAQHWTGIKAQGGFDRMDKSILHQLSEEIGIPYRDLAYQRKTLLRRWSVEPLMGAIRHKAPENSTQIQVPDEPVLRTRASFGSLPDRLLFLDPILQQRQERVVSIPTTPSKRFDRYFAFMLPKRRRRKSQDKENDDEAGKVPFIGDRVELLYRPLRTFGTIRYVGPVQFAEGLRIGVELDSRLGKSDGSIEGVRYFQTDPQRALFVQLDDFKILYHKR